MANFRREDHILTFNLPYDGYPDAMVRFLPGAAAIGMDLLFLISFRNFFTAARPTLTNFQSTIFVSAALMIALGLASLAASFSRRLVLLGYPARFAIKIDLKKKTIRAVNPQDEKTLWLQPFDPEKVYVAPVSLGAWIPGRNAPALVYGFPRQEQGSLSSAPTVRQAVLAFGTVKQLEALYLELKNA